MFFDFSSLFYLATALRPDLGILTPEPGESRASERAASNNQLNERTNHAIDGRVGHWRLSFRSLEDLLAC